VKKEKPEKEDIGQDKRGCMPYPSYIAEKKKENTEGRRKERGQKKEARKERIEYKCIR
jgi:hypothetical protein